jgi:hypothetical protein
VLHVLLPNLSSGTYAEEHIPRDNPGSRIFFRVGKVLTTSRAVMAGFICMCGAIEGEENLYENSQAPRTISGPARQPKDYL